MTVILAFFLSMFLPSLTQASSEGTVPHFAAELPLFEGANITKNQQGYSDPVTGNPGDNIAGLIYIHNDVKGSTATNSKVKVDLPSTTTNKSAVLKETLSAENANPTEISDTLTANLSADANINYVPGSAKFYHVVNNQSVEIPFPNGDGNNLTTTGVNLGKLQGCTEFVYFISFIFKTTPKDVPAANFTVAKTVRNISCGETSFVKSNYANPGETLEYKIDFQNTGKAAADIFVVDKIPTGTTFVPGSATLTRSGTEQKLSDILVGEGVSIANVAAGEKGTIKFKVKVNSDVKDKEVLVNNVTLYFNKISICDTAQTTVKVVVTPTPPVPTTPALPVSGPVETASALVSLSGMSIFGFMKYRKFMALKETKIIGELLSK